MVRLDRLGRLYLSTKQIRRVDGEFVIIASKSVVPDAVVVKYLTQIRMCHLVSENDLFFDDVVTENLLVVLKAMTVQSVFPARYARKYYPVLYLEEGEIPLMEETAPKES